MVECDSRTMSKSHTSIGGALAGHMYPNMPRPRHESERCSHATVTRPIQAGATLCGENGQRLVAERLIRKCVTRQAAGLLSVAARRRVRG